MDNRAVLLPPRFLSAVLAIGTHRPDGTKSWIASGVLYARVTEAGRIRPVFVTNKHVIDGLRSAHVRINPEADGPAVELNVVLQDNSGSPYWFPHPDPDVDIAVTPVDLDHLQTQGLDFAFFQPDTAIKLDQLRERRVSEGDDIYVLGFPLGITGDERSRVGPGSGLDLCTAAGQSSADGGGVEA